jgi:quercetin dioxygenase-like cupin family protein
MAWSPTRAGVDEKLLELTPDGRRRTALVRLAPGAVLPALGEGCLDVFVLAGELRDERVIHTSGAYLHTPVGALHTKTGCTLFVKQRPARRRARHVLDTRMVVFERSHTVGLWSAPLHDDLDGKVVLLRFDPGTAIATHRHDDGEEFFVLDGEVRDEFGSYATHCWVRQPPGSYHRIESRGGCLFLTFAHHLAC